MDLKSLTRCNEVKKSFLDAVTREFTKPEQLTSGNQPEQINSNIIKCLNTAAESTIPKATKTKTKELWKEDCLLNELLKQINEISQGSDEYKILTKKIKKRVNQLKNEKFAKEVEK